MRVWFLLSSTIIAVLLMFCGGCASTSADKRAEAEPRPAMRALGQPAPAPPDEEDTDGPASKRSDATTLEFGRDQALEQRRPRARRRPYRATLVPGESPGLERSPFSRSGLVIPLAILAPFAQPWQLGWILLPALCLIGVFSSLSSGAAGATSSSGPTIVTWWQYES